MWSFVNLEPVLFELLRGKQLTSWSWTFTTTFYPNPGQIWKRYPLQFDILFERIHAYYFQHYRDTDMEVGYSLKSLLNAKNMRLIWLKMESFSAEFNQIAGVLRPDWPIWTGMGLLFKLCPLYPSCLITGPSQRIPWTCPGWSIMIWLTLWLNTPNDLLDWVHSQCRLLNLVPWIYFQN